MTNRRSYQTLNESSFNVNSEVINDGVRQSDDTENITIVASKKRVFYFNLL
jgi:hypothetical protein